MTTGAVGLRVSLGLALVALIIVAIAENGRIPVDNPATHLELTMVHEAMVLEYSGRHLAVVELAAFAETAALRLAHCAACSCHGASRRPDAAPAAYASGSRLPRQGGSRRVSARLFETTIAKMRVFGSRSSSALR